VQQRYRAIALIIKTNLEAVIAGIATFEQAFLAYLLLPDGDTREIGSRRVRSPTPSGVEGYRRSYLR